MLVKAACSPGQAFSNQVSLFLSLLHPSSFLAISYRDLGFFFFSPSQQRIPQPLPRPPALLPPVPSLGSSRASSEPGSCACSGLLHPTASSRET